MLSNHQLPRHRDGRFISCKCPKCGALAEGLHRRPNRPSRRFPARRAQSRARQRGGCMTSNQDLLAELEAAAAKWVLEKNKYTFESLRDARSAVLKQMTPDETSELPTFAHVGNIFDKDVDGDVLVDWDSEAHEPAVGTLLFVRLYTQGELDAARANAEEVVRGLIVDDG